MNAAPDQVTDFEAILDQLRRSGLTMTAIEHATGINRTTLVQYLVNGVVPLHPSGEKLIAFYCQYTSQLREGVPQRQRLPSAAHALR